MKVNVDWLKDYSDININTRELANILTMTGSKVENIEIKGDNIKNVVIGKILEIIKHPDADKLVITKVDIKADIIQIVTGATNINVGDIVPVAKEEAELPGGIKIKQGKLRGITSFGMLCSCGELGISLTQYDNQIEDGILILPKNYEKYLGEDIVEILELKEEILEFEITPNRPDCLSIEGLGREVAAALSEEYKAPHKKIDNLIIKSKEEIEGLKVDITAPDLCYRYVARVVKNVKIMSSPDWMVKRLNACGIRSINNIVDITNYVMLEMGQPMHAFDINSIQGKHITVRRANKEEKIVTLDEQERILDENMLVIADDQKAVAIAGVMGGLNSEIEANTETIVFESAVFNGASVRKTAKKLGLRTESSSRYEKELWAYNCQRAAARAVELVELLGAGEPVEEQIDIYPTIQKTKKIEFCPEEITKLLGIQISINRMIEILESLDIKVEGNIAIVPYFRQDINKQADLAEEIIRIEGFEKLKSTLIYSETVAGGKSKEQKLQDTIKDILVNKGLYEIYNYAFINEKDMDNINLSKQDSLRNKIIKIKNPISEDYTLMRPTTLPSMLKSISFNNSKKNQDVYIFEIGKKYINDDEQIQNSKLPTEIMMLTIGMYGKQIDFYVLKGIIENILEGLGITKYNIISHSNNESYHPGRTATINIGNIPIITFGEIHPLVAQNYNLSEKVYVAEVNVDKLYIYAKYNKKYVQVPKYPAVERDIALVINEQIEVGEIEKIIEKKSKKLIESYKLFDLYRNEQIGNDKKSVAYSLIFRAHDRTLTDEEVDNILSSIIYELENKLNAQLRK